MPFLSCAPPAVGALRTGFLLVFDAGSIPVYGSLGSSSLVMGRSQLRIPKFLCGCNIDS
ncbi:hypothetical protein GQ55_4G044800 [Panicum hallii var. hallii]|uniref:Uncharacterized protein n=2 Tax=Panicum hallii TaxID=206008 RepID=A0A2T7DV56_9POAL|nr:hypothetical protein GQ55_4G044800 [Panicum hallii var. hallii]PVH47364.1 hypothetical protein PAHAL_4G043800 [Panicum hallii]